MLKKILVGGLSVLLAGLVIYGCGKVVETSGPSTSNTGGIIGTVKGQSDQALAGVTVSAAGESALTNADGWFSISGLDPSNREVVSFSLTDKAPVTKVTEVIAGQNSYITAVLFDRATAQSLDASAGGTLTFSNGAAISIGANALVDEYGDAFTGTANVSVTDFDPGTELGRGAFSGDFAGRMTSTGDDLPFVSQGFVDFSMTGSGPLDFASGESGVLDIPIPSDQAAGASATIEVWSFNEVEGYWIYEGIGTKTQVGSDWVYRCTVTHSSMWNADYLYDQAYLKGRVIDSNGNPVAYAKAYAIGVDYSAQTDATTGTDGTFDGLPVKPNSLVDVYAMKGGHVSATSRETTPAAGQTKDVGDIVLTAPEIQATLVWGINPSDLDSHLTVPASAEGGTRFHLYYSTRGSLLPGTYPYALLDTDDMSSWGPEITTVFTPLEGRYRYSIHNFSGQSSWPIENSSAEVTLIAKGYTYVFSVPTSNPNSTNYDVWRVFDLVVDSSGNVAVESLNDFASSSDPQNAYLTSPGSIYAVGASKKKK